MAIAPTADFDQLVIEVEFTAESGTYVKVCGMVDYSIDRKNNTETSLVPDCADESLPLHTKRQVASQDVTISGTGSWALTNHQSVYNWWKSGSTLNVRITNAKVTADGSSGDTETETIPMILADLKNARTKGQVVSAEIALEQNGAITLGLIS
jgi:hypothetical protein